MRRRDQYVMFQAALDLLNEHGRDAADILHELLQLEENSEAEAWVSAFYEVRRETTH